MATAYVRDGGAWVPVGIKSAAPDSDAEDFAFLQTFEGFWDARHRYRVGSPTLENMGTGGTALDMQLGTLSAQPIFLEYLGRTYYAQTYSVNEYMTTPVASVPLPTTSLDVRFAMRGFYNMSWKTPTSGASEWIGRINTVTSGSSWGFGMSSVGVPYALLSSNGTATTTINATANIFDTMPSLAWDTLMAFRAVWTSAPTVEFYVKVLSSVSNINAEVQSNTGWTQIGSTVVASVPTTLFNNTASVTPYYGKARTSGGTGAVAGHFYYAEINTDGVRRVSVDPSLVVTTVNPQSWTSAEGIQVIVNWANVNSIYHYPPVTHSGLMFDGSNDFMAIPDNALLDFDATDSWTWGVATQSHGLANADTGYFSKQASAGSPGWGLRQSLTTKVSAQVVGASTGSVLAGSTPGNMQNEQPHLLWARRDYNGGSPTIQAGRNLNDLGAVTSDTTTGGFANSTQVSVMRRYDASGFTNGSIFRGAFFVRRALTTDELTQVYNYFIS